MYTKTRQLPMPKGIPARIGMIQWTCGRQVQAKMIWPAGTRSAARHSGATSLSGSGFPVASFSFRRLILRRISGSAATAVRVPHAIPRYDSPVSNGFQPRIFLKTIGSGSRRRRSQPLFWGNWECVPGETYRPRSTGTPRRRRRQDICPRTAGSAR
jgi:hypothetical protein